MSRAGVFISLEGPEGAGKSSQSRWLISQLKKASYSVLFLKDPGSTELGRKARHVLLHSKTVLSPMTDALLFIAGRVQLVEEKIKPALAKGQVVVCDRYHDSTVAYQGYAEGVDVRWLDRIGREAIGGLMPSLTLLLDLPTETGFSRIRRPHDRMERQGKEFHRKVREAFLKMAHQEPKRIAIINAGAPRAQVRRQIESVVFGHLTSRHK